MRRIRPTIEDLHARIALHMSLGDTPEQARRAVLDEDHALAILDERDGRTR